MNNEEKYRFLNKKIRLNETYVKDIPMTLYKYKSFNQYAIDMIKNQYIYLCPAGKEDDPTECDVSFDINDYIAHNNLNKIGVTLVLDYLEQNCQLKDFDIIANQLISIVNRKGYISNKDLLEWGNEAQLRYNNQIEIIDMVNFIRDSQNVFQRKNINDMLLTKMNLAIIAKDACGIGSLSETCTNYIMWDEYAERNTGICIQYNLENYKYLDRLYPVVYTQNRNINIFENLLLDLLAEMIESFKISNVPVDRTNYLRLYLTKEIKWEEQLEWRLIGEAKEKIKAPIIEKILYGKNMSKENVKILKEICDSNNIKTQKGI